MAFRPIGVYLLTGSALYTQTKTTHHLTEMSSLATKSTSLTALAMGETEAAVELQQKAAIDADEGLNLQSQAIDLEASAERETAEAAEETILAEKYEEEAEALHEQAVKDKLQSESLVEQSEELEAASLQENIEAGQDLAAAETYKVQSEFEFEQAAKAEKLAEEAEARAAEDEGAALKQESASVEDAKAFGKTETKAGEDAEAVAACEVIPILNVFCDIGGAITEAGFQSIAAVEAAKAAVESIAAATWSGKEREEILIASDNHAEAAKDMADGEKYQSLSAESAEKATSEKADSASLQESGAESQSIAEEKLAASKEEELLSKVDEEDAARHSAQASEHEAMAAEEREASVLSQVESEEHMGESTAEEFESQSEEIDAESKENEARKLMEQSIGHGMHALWFVLSSIFTAFGVIYIVTMKIVTKTVMPTLYTAWNGHHVWTGSDLMQKASESFLHAGLILASIVTTSSSANFKEMTPWYRWKELIALALMVGVLESFLVYSMSTACCCLMKGQDRMTALSDAGSELTRKIIHIVPAVLIELLIILTLFGPGLMNDASVIYAKPLWIWSAVLALVGFHIWVFPLKSLQTELEKGSKSSSSGWEEDVFANDPSDFQNGSLIGTSVEKEYGSIEEVSLLTSVKQPSDDVSISMYSNFEAHGSILETKKRVERYRIDWQQIGQVHHAKLDLLVLSLMAMLLYHCSPVIKVLHPLVATSYAAFGSLLSTPVLCVGVIVVTSIVHFVFVK